MICCVLLTFSTVSAIDMDGNLTASVNHLDGSHSDQSAFISQSESSKTNLNANNNLRVSSGDYDCVETMNELSNLDSKDSKDNNLSKDKTSLKSDLNSIDSDEYSLKSSLSSINSSKKSSYEDGDNEYENLEDSLDSKNKNSLSSNALGAGTSTFGDLQTMINNAQEGSTINLDGKTFIGNGSFITIKKAITINGGSATNLARFDARNLSYIFKISASNVHIKNCYFSYSTNCSVYFFGNGSSIDNCHFDYNYKHLWVAVNIKYFSLTNCNFTNGKTDMGSTAYVVADNATVKNCNFINNEASGTEQCYGAALQIGASSSGINEGYVVNCTFINNRVITTHSYSHAGALCFRPGIKVYNSTFINNYCNRMGGATTLHSDGEIMNCTFINNSAGEYGGAISTGLMADNISVNITGCTFINNYAPMGGAILIKGNNVKVTNSTFKENKARENDGGAVYILGNDALILNSTFQSNYAKNVGAGILINGSYVTVLNSSFARNNASYGAGIYVIGSNANLFSSNFTNHNVKNGSVYIKGIGAYVYNCNFASNTGENGAALYIEGSNTTLILSNFTNNNVTKDGGAIYVVGSNAKLMASNFLYNNAIPSESDIKSGLGGAVYIKGNSNTIDSSSFKYNTARNGSAIYTDGKNMNLSNDNFDRNQAWSYVLDSVIKPSSSYFNRSDILINLTLIGGNNIANAIYNTASVNDIYFYNVSYISSKGKKVTTSNEIHPVNGASNSQNGALLYQDDREDNQLVNVIVYKDPNSKSTSLSAINKNDIILNKTFTTGILGNVSLNLSSSVGKAIAPGNYLLYAKHTEDDYYKEIDEDNQFEILPLVDVAVDIVSSKDIVEYNRTNKFTVKVINNGPNNATDVQVSAVLPKGLILVSSSPSVGTYNSSTGIWTIGNLNSGVNQTLAINTRANTTGAVNYPVSVSSYEKDTNEANNKDNQSIKIPECDLLIDIASSNHSPKYSDIVNWTVTVKNNGPDDASKVVVSLGNLSGNELIYQKSTNANFNISTQTLELSKLASGSNVSFVITTKVNASNKKITVNSSVSSDTFEYNLNNNQDNDYVNVAPLCDVGITVKVSNRTANRNDLVKWTITVKNYGPDKASNVNVALSDLASLGLGLVNKSDANYASNEWNVGDLNKDASKELVISTKVNTENKNIVLKGTVNTSTYETNKANNLANDTLSVNPYCDVLIEVTASDNSANKNDVITWTVNVKNNGPNQAKDVKVSLTNMEKLGLIVQNRSFTFKDIAVLENSTFNFNKSSNIWSIGSMASGDISSMTVKTKVNCSDKVLSVEGNVSTSTYELNKANNHDDDLLTVEELCDLAVEVNASKKTANKGDIVNWTIKIKNNGPDTASDVFLTVSDLESLGMVFVNSSSKDFDSESFAWEIGELASGKGLTLILATQVDTSDETIMVEADVDTSTYELNKANNADNDSLNVNPCCDIVIDISVSDSPVNKEDIVNWTIVVTNDGPDDAKAVVVNLTDLEPLALIIMNVSESSYDNGQWTIGDLPDGESQSLIITTKANCSNDTIKLDGIVDTSTFELDKSNNHNDDILEIDPLCDLSIEISVSDSPVNNGDIVNWTIVVANDGPDGASDVIVSLSDLESLNLEILNVSEDNFNPETYEWIIGDLDNNENASLIISAKVNTSDDILDVESTVDSKTFELNKDNNYDNESLIVNPLCDLIIDISVSDSPVNTEDLVDWTITVTNDGPDMAENVKVYLNDLDALNLILVNASEDSFDGDAYQWIIGNLDNGDAVELLITTRVNASNKTIEVESAVLSDTFELNKENNYDNDTVTVNPLCDLIVVVDVSNSTINKDEVVNWTITVTNDGPDTAENVILDLSDLEDLGLIVLNVSDDSYNPESGKWIIGDLAPGETVDLIVTTQANVSNASLPVEAIVQGDTYELNKDNNHDDKLLDVNPLCDLVIEITVSNSSVNKGGTVEWTIVVYNDGPDDASDVIVTLDDLKTLGLILSNVTYGTTSMDISYDGSRLFVKDISSEDSENSDSIDESDSSSPNMLKASSKLDGVGSDLDNGELKSLKSGSYLSDDSSNDSDKASNTFDEETNLWYIGDLAKGNSISLKLLTEVNRSNDNITLPSNVDTSTYEVVKSNNFDSAIVEVLPLADNGDNESVNSSDSNGDNPLDGDGNSTSDGSNPDGDNSSDGDGNSTSDGSDPNGGNGDEPLDGDGNNSSNGSGNPDGSDSNGDNPLDGDGNSTSDGSDNSDGDNKSGDNSGNPDGSDSNGDNPLDGDGNSTSDGSGNPDGSGSSDGDNSGNSDAGEKSDDGSSDTDGSGNTDGNGSLDEDGDNDSGSGSGNYGSDLYDMYPWDDYMDNKTNDGSNKNNQGDNNSHAGKKVKNPTKKNLSNHVQAKQQKGVPMKNTGHPLALLVLTIFALFTLSYRKFKF
ncbi:right-handed parallel beta-helix repeat-containing protein [Methanobrevibacter ruminantium]|nr:DUF11 domain-containing protein [Methanobrevibacter ruminantium]